jgi:hypothetical protein
LSDETKRALQALGYLAEDEVDVQAEDAAIDAEERAGLELRPSVIQQMPEPVRP